MKKIQIVFIVLFLTALLVPIVTFNFTPHSVSDIDNRMLAESPFLATQGEDFTSAVETYVNDRIGLRSEMILSYTVLNDRLFGKMVHPGYTYGTNGYVFGAGVSIAEHCEERHVIFADFVKKMQSYCEERGITFLFVFDPAKPAVYSEYVSPGIRYSRGWAEEFLELLDKRGVSYLDNTAVLRQKKEEGIAVFNQKYDANHWNYIGAFYGCNAILERLAEREAGVHINDLSEFSRGQTLKTSLLVSQFPIHEEIPELTPLTPADSSRTSEYKDELRLDENYTAYGYYTNEKNAAPKTLVFQGSYMNSYGYSFLANGLGEYIAVHDYQNVIDFPYYVNIFKPQIVVFEVAEYTFGDTYFDSARMEQARFNPLFDPTDAKEELLSAQEICVQEGATLTVLSYEPADEFDAVWLLLGGEEYDMEKTQTGYSVTVPTEKWQAAGEYQIATACADETVLRRPA